MSPVNKQEGTKSGLWLEGRHFKWALPTRRDNAPYPAASVDGRVMKKETAASRVPGRRRAVQVTKRATLSFCVRAEFVGIAPAIQRSSVVMHSAGGQRKRAVVIGGSIGGLFAGLFLRKVGWEVSIQERAGEELGSRRPDGIATHDDLREALAVATGQGDEVGVAVEGRIVLTRSGDVVCEVARPQVLASWDRIWQRLRLRAGDVYHHGSALVSVAHDEQRAVARFDDGSEVTADLLVAADGIQSTVRRRLLPAVESRYAGYVAWRGLADMAELSGKARDLLRNRFAFCLPDRKHRRWAIRSTAARARGPLQVVSGTAPPIRRRICRACLPAPTAINIPSRFRRTGCIPMCSRGCGPTLTACLRRLSPR